MHKKAKRRFDEVGDSFERETLLGLVSCTKVCIGLMMASCGEVVGLKPRPTIIGSSDREGAKQKHQPRLVFFLALSESLAVKLELS